MNPALQIIEQARALGIELSVSGDNLHYKAQPGTLTLELKRGLKEYKAAIILILSLPAPARPGEELATLRREIGDMARAEEAQWIHSNELDPAWPPSAKVYKRLHRKDETLWLA
jgi:TubC N-terminal docking domain